MTDKENNIKTMIELIIANIDEFGHEFVTYKAVSMKELLENTLEYIKTKEQECEELKKDCPKRCKSDNYKQALEDIKNACENECIEGNTGYVVDTSIILDIINELQTKENING